MAYLRSLYCTTAKDYYLIIPAPTVRGCQTGIPNVSYFLHPLSLALCVEAIGLDLHDSILYLTMNSSG